MRKLVVLELCLLLGLAAAPALAGDLVKLRYSIWTQEGKLLESIPDGQVAIMEIDRMMPGWRDAVKEMQPGDTRRITVSSENSGGKIPAGTTYDIEMTLVEVFAGPQTPPDVAAAPDDAERSRSGLAWKVLREPSGTKSPGRRSTVRVHYSGWTADGRLFDSTALRGQPAELRLDQVIAGWTEGIQLMREGEVRRFWIPAKLAYANSSGPQGMLVFEVELLEVR